MSKTFIWLVVAGLFAFIALTAALWFFFMIEERRGRVHDLADELAFSLRREQQLSGIEALARDTREKREQLDRFFVAEENIIGFIERIESLGAQSGVALSVRSVEVAEMPQHVIKNAEALEFLKLRLDASGSWESVYRFFTLLDALPYAVIFDRAALAERSQKEQQQAEAARAPWRLEVSMRVGKLK